MLYICGLLIVCLGCFIAVGYDFPDLGEPSDFGLDCGDLDW